MAGCWKILQYIIYICILAPGLRNLHAGTLIVEAATLECYDGKDLSSYVEATLDNPEVLITSNCINVSQWTYIYAFGYNGSRCEKGAVTVLDSLIKSGNKNVVLINWAKEVATGKSSALSYALRAVPEATPIATAMSKALIKMKQCGLKLNLVKLVGHSLGAQLVGNIGRDTVAMGEPVIEIIGLDPAGPLYDISLTPLKRIDASCGTNVMIISTDPGGYGSTNINGTINVFVNKGLYLNGTKAQPGCVPATALSQLTLNNTCSHERAWRIFAGAILNKKQYIASKAADYDDWVAQNGKGKDIIYLGDNIKRNAKGNYYMSINGKDPLGRGKDGLRPLP